jgi:hypothetical protein
VTRPHQLCVLVGLLFLGLPRAATAQPLLDPNFVEFTASPDHDLLDDGRAIVQGYELRLYLAGASSPSRTGSIGKPAPDGTGTIRVALNTIFNPMPAGGTVYEARIAAVGPGGSAESGPSNTFSFQVACTYAVSPGSRSIAAGGGSSTFSVSAPAGCAWTATETASWITITSGASGSGNGTVAFTATANTAGGSRNTTFSIAGHSPTVSQTGAACTFTVSPISQAVARAGGNVTFAVTAPTGCTWSASEQASWISIASGATGSGNGSVVLAVAAHTGTTVRSATATIAGRTVTLSQAVPVAPSAPTGLRRVGQ